LILNYSTSAAGGIRVEIQDATGQAIAEYTLADCNLIIGNEIERMVTWENGADVSSLSGKEIRLRFVMNDAHLYSLQFK
jgi:hypothetical protein